MITYIQAGKQREVGYENIIKAVECVDAARNETGRREGGRKDETK